MKMEDSIRVCLSKYAVFAGRASRSELWWFMLFVLLASAACAVISDTLSTVFSIATLLPALAVTTRRLHDVDKNGWMQLIGLIPVLGWIMMLIWLCEQGKDEPNRFGQASPWTRPQVLDYA
jgi:uncharacterized membrane protein YhaH (DUF805 family)